MKKNISVFILGISLLLISCSASLEKFQKEECQALPGDKTFNIIQANCLRCHGNDLNTKENICAYKTIVLDVVESGKMPKFGSLSDADKKALLDWQ